MRSAEVVAYLLYAAMHAFDPAFRGSSRAPDDQLVSAAQQLFRRAVGATRYDRSPPADSAEFLRFTE
jgi:hypothetical protein